VRLAERARKNRKKIYDELQTKQRACLLSLPQTKLSELLEFLTGSADDASGGRQQRYWRNLIEWLEIYGRASEQDRGTVRRLPEFVKEWERRARRAAWRVRGYLEYFDQAEA